MERDHDDLPPLDSDDEALWDAITKNDTPLDHKRAQPKPKPVQENTVSGAKLEEKPAKTEPKPPKPKQTPVQSNLDVNSQSRVNQSAAKDLRRGMLPIEARIDLHGLTRNQAYVALQQFIQRSHTAQKRVCLVVTGKGNTQKDGTKTGVIRASFADWMNEPDINNKVLMFCPAQPKDGGGGAFYVLLKRIKV